MTEENTTSLLARVLEWLPEHWRDNADQSSTLLNIILNEVSSDRDVRITGGASSARAEAALIAVFHKLLSLEEGKRFQTLVICPSRESEDIMERLANELAQKTGISVLGTSATRSITTLKKAFTKPTDIFIGSLATIQKLIKNKMLELDQIRTVITDDLEWFEVQGEMNKLLHFANLLPAARQIIGLTSQGEVDQRIVDLLHAPAICRAPDFDSSSAPANIKERVIVVSDRDWGPMISRMAQGPSTLYISDSPTETNRIIALLKALGEDIKRATFLQTESARQTLLVKFSAGLVTRLVMPTTFVGDFNKGTLHCIVHTSVPGGARPYLEHAKLLQEGGEMVVITTPNNLPILDSLLLSAQKKLSVENPFELPDIPEEIGQIVTRQKLTVRPKPQSFTTTAVTEPEEISQTSETTYDEEPQGKRFYKQKNPKFSKTRKFNKKDKPRYQSRRYEDEYESDRPDYQVEGEETPVNEESSERKTWKKRRSPFHKRFDKRPYRERRDGTASDPVPADISSESQNSGVVGETDMSDSSPASRTEKSEGERSWRPKTKYNRFKKPYRKDRRFQQAEGDDTLVETSASVQATSVKDTDDNDISHEQPKKFNKHPSQKRAYPSKPKKPQHRDRNNDWDDEDDNFGNSIHYQPRRQNLRTLRSDEPLHWEPSDPFHPSAQALSLPQMMPDENGFRPHHSKNDRKGNFSRTKKTGFKKYRNNGNK